MTEHRTSNHLLANELESRERVDEFLHAPAPETSLMIFKNGMRVRHWFAGTGTVLKVIRDGGSCARVLWDSGQTGIAYLSDLRVL